MKNVGMSVVTHTCNPSTVEVEVGRSQSHSCPLLWERERERPCSKTKLEHVCRYSLLPVCPKYSFGFLKQGLMYFRLAQRQFSVARIRHVITMLYLVYFNFIVGCACTVMRVHFYVNSSNWASVQACVQMPFIHWVISLAFIIFFF